jgi:hypothetical protein
MSCRHGCWGFSCLAGEENRGIMGVRYLALSFGLVFEHASQEKRWDDRFVRLVRVSVLSHRLVLHSKDGSDNTRLC